MKLPSPSSSNTCKMTTPVPGTNGKNKINALTAPLRSGVKKAQYGQGWVVNLSRKSLL